VDRMFYQTDADRLGFVYQNPTYVGNPYPNHEPFRHHTGVEKELPLATIFIRPQVYKGVCSPNDALRQGTAFVELYRPFKRRDH